MINCYQKCSSCFLAQFQGQENGAKAISKIVNYGS